MSRAPRWMLAGLVVAICFAWAGTIWGTWFAWDVSSSLPDRASLRSIGDMAQATTIYDAHDRPVFQIFKEQRVEIPLARMSPLLVKAIVAIEDQRFYEHRGVDAVRIAGAVLANLREGRRAQGGSTITQQLARQSFLSRDKTLRRKLKEIILAARLELTYSKQEILELYLNKVYFGDGLYGVEAASLGYFGSHAADLTLPEAALLAGLVQSPSRYAPTVSLERAVNRRNVVLQTMRDSGAITAEEYTRARDAVPQLVDRLRREEAHGRYFKEMVRQLLVEKFGWQRVYQGGLRVYTTIEPADQEAAERIVADQLEQLEAQRAKELKAKLKKGEQLPADGPPLQAALVSLDPATGAVRALVGGRDFDASRFNRAVQARRQPGSAFKPFVFAAAIENGFSPASVVDRLDEPVMTLQGEWVPEDEHTDVSEMTLRTALRTSSNRAAVRLLEEVGIDRTVAYAKQLGVGSLPSVPSLALGSGEVTLLSMTAAYASFDNHGELPTPMFVRRVEDDEGAVLLQQKPATRQVISDTTAFLMSSMLADVVNFGTAYKARRVGFTLPAAGKTGTTNDFVDAWFVGFTPRLVTGVWVGFDRPQSILRSGYAGDVAVPLWARYMKEATKGDKPEWFTAPKGVIGVNVCRLSGKLPNNGCDAVEVVNNQGETETRSMIYTEYFVRGTQPTAICPLHPGVSVLGHIAGLFGKEGQPPASAEQLGLLAKRPPDVPAATPTAGRSETPPPPASAAQQQEQPKKKRGFWARVFGLGKDEDKNKKKDEPADQQPSNLNPQQ
jgi:penicillin-binding protein 1A